MVISKQNEKCSFLKYQTTKLYLIVEGISDSQNWSSLQICTYLIYDIDYILKIISNYASIQMKLHAFKIYS